MATRPSLLEQARPDIVLNATLGFAGLPATMWALEHGVTLALANKESLVAAGDLALAAQERGGGRLIPVDSEHSALFQCAQLGEPESLVLTASGGPFRGRSRDELADITPEQALAHPTWTMGAKITIDSATLANKGLEVIEAHFLFGLPYDRIEVVVHPTSIVHGLVRFRDGAAIAHLGLPDMRVPISYALTYPDRATTPVPALDLTAGPLEFFEPDTDTFRLLALAREAGERGGTYPCAFNAANEVAVAAFLDGRIGFLDIAALGGGRARPDGRRTRARPGRAARGGLARPRGGGAAYGRSRGDPRARDPRDDPRGGPLLRRARRRDDAAEVLSRLRPADREDDARRRRVRDRLDPARRLREDPRHEPPVAGRPGGDAEPGGPRALPRGARAARRRDRA